MLDFIPWALKRVVSRARLGTTAPQLLMHLLHVFLGRMLHSARLYVDFFLLKMRRILPLILLK